MATSELQTLRDQRKITLAQYLAGIKIKSEAEYVTVGHHGVLRIFLKRSILGIGRNGKQAYRAPRYIS